jgi:hypothetical protein
MLKMYQRSYNFNSNYLEQHTKEALNRNNTASIIILKLFLTIKTQLFPKAMIRKCGKILK